MHSSQQDLSSRRSGQSVPDGTVQPALTAAKGRLSDSTEQSTSSAEARVSEEEQPGWLTLPAVVEEPEHLVLREYEEKLQEITQLSVDHSNALSGKMIRVLLHAATETGEWIQLGPYASLTLKLEAGLPLPTVAGTTSTEPTSLKIRRARICFDKIHNPVFLGMPTDLTFESTVNDDFTLEYPNDENTSPSDLERMFQPDFTRWRISLVPRDPFSKDKKAAKYRSDEAKWAPKYWFNEIACCHSDLSYQCRAWVRVAREFLEKEGLAQEDQTKAKTVRDIKVIVAPDVRRGQLSWIVTFHRPEGSRFAVGDIVSFQADDGIFKERAPMPRFSTGASGWVGMINTYSEAEDTMSARLFNKVERNPGPDHRPLDVLGVTITFPLFDSETRRAMRARLWAYYKMIPFPAARQEAIGQSFEREITARLQFDLKPLLFRNVPLPVARDCVLHDSNGKPLDLESFPQRSRLLNARQIDAVTAGLQSADHLLIVNGPPGSGKSTLISQMALHFFKAGLKVLLCSPTNTAINGLLKKCVLTAHFEDIEVRSSLVRVVSDARVKQNLYLDSAHYDLEAEEEATSLTANAEAVTNKFALPVRRLELAKSCLALHDYRVDAQAYIDLFEQFRITGEFEKTSEVGKLERLTKRFDKLLFSKCRLVFTTCSGASHTALVDSFRPDVIVVDESAYARTDQVLNCLVYYPSARLVVLAGDPKQLPPFVAQENSTDFETSLHETLDERCHPGVVQLNTQHRMEPRLAEYISETFYDGQLHTAESIIKQPRAGSKQCQRLLEMGLRFGPFVINDSDCFFDVLNSQSKQMFTASTGNEVEVAVTTALVQQITKDNAFAPGQVLVLTPYEAQRSLIHQDFRAKRIDVSVKTIDSSQGDEADILIVCLARASNKAGFLREPNRVNVAMSRPRFARFVIGSHTFWMSHSQEVSMRRYCQFMEDRGRMQSGNWPGFPELTPAEPPVPTEEDITLSTVDISDELEQYRVESLSTRNVEQPSVASTGGTENTEGTWWSNVGPSIVAEQSSTGTTGGTHDTESIW